MASIDDGIPVRLPVITGISLPEKVQVSHTATIIISVSGETGETLSYQLLSASDKGSFDLSFGTITLDGIIDDIVTIYTAPEQAGIYTYTVTVINSQQNTTENDFNIEVVALPAFTKEVSVQFNPVITTLKGKRSGSNVIWTATVNYDGSQDELRYLWEFDGGLSFVNNSVNPATMEGYTSSTTGTLTLSVADQHNNQTFPGRFEIHLIRHI